MQKGRDDRFSHHDYHSGSTSTSAKSLETHRTHSPFFIRPGRQRAAPASPPACLPLRLPRQQPDLTLSQIFPATGTNRCRSPCPRWTAPSSPSYALETSLHQSPHRMLYIERQRVVLVNSVSRSAYCCFPSVSAEGPHEACPSKEGRALTQEAFQSIFLDNCIGASLLSMVSRFKSS